MFEIIRTDRTDETKVQVAHNLPDRETADDCKDALDGVRVHLMPDGTPRYRYEVREERAR